MRTMLNLPKIKKGKKPKAKDEGKIPTKKVRPVFGIEPGKWHDDTEQLAIGIYPHDFTAVEMGKIGERETGVQDENFRKRCRELAGWGIFVLFKDKRKCKVTGKMAQVFRWKWRDLAKEVSSNGKERKRNKRRKLRSVS